MARSRPPVIRLRRLWMSVGGGAEPVPKQSQLWQRGPEGSWSIASGYEPELPMVGPPGGAVRGSARMSGQADGTRRACASKPPTRGPHEMPTALGWSAAGAEPQADRRRLWRRT